MTVAVFRGVSPIKIVGTVPGVSMPATGVVVDDEAKDSRLLDPPDPPPEP